LHVSVIGVSSRIGSLQYFVTSPCPRLAEADKQFVLSFEDSLCDLHPAHVRFETQFGDVFQVASNFGFVGADGELFRDIL